MHKDGGGQAQSVAACESRSRAVSWSGRAVQRLRPAQGSPAVKTQSYAMRNRVDARL